MEPTQVTEKASKFMGFAMDFAPKLAGALIVLLIGIWITNWIVAILKRRMEKTKVDESLRPFLMSLVSVMLKMMVIFSAAGIVGIQTTSFVAVLGAAGLAVGLALQGSLSNFASGVLVLLFRPYRVGDLITAQGFNGVVKEIQIFTTVLITPDNRTIIIPNSAITSGAIENLSVAGTRVLETLVPIDPTEDMEKVRRIFEEVAKKSPGYLAELPITSPVVDLSPTATTLAFRFSVIPDVYLDAQAFAKEEVRKSFQAAGISGEHEPVMEIKLVQS
ncbi:mechanosensitive ion channel domain-containing protein [Haliscomenobacter sp.]|uniref:mechanosensitive ion channel family protein n=1 Tax=Haliscomenobacter sp. TaxID=2717303 RepID=UPI0033651D14